jgi:hypothetical protein
MQYTDELLEKHLGSKFDPKADYILETHRGAASRVVLGTHVTVGKVPDFSDISESGTMIVMVKKPVPKVPDPGVGSGISSKAAPDVKPEPKRSRATPVPTVLPTPKVEEPVKAPKIAEPVKVEPLTTEAVEEKIVVKPIWGPKAETKPVTTGYKKPTTKKPSGGSKK